MERRKWVHLGYEGTGKGESEMLFERIERDEAEVEGGCGRGWMPWHWRRQAREAMKTEREENVACC